MVSKSGIKPDPENVYAVSKMKPPTNVKETRRFLGMAGFYCKHIEKLSAIAAHLTDLTKKSQPLKWSETCQRVFEEVKRRLVSSPVLVKANLSQQFVLETDVSQHHVATVLLQYDEKGPRTIRYFSNKLKPAEVRYSTTDREVLAIVLACRQFHHYLWGSKFIVCTDHQPNVSVFKPRTKSPRMNRWILEMRDYCYKIEYKAGKRNVVADQLSRPVRVIQGREDRKWLGKSKEEIKVMQRAEARWREIVEYLVGGRIPRSKYLRATLDQFA